VKLPLRHAREKSRGQAIVEFALILPILVLMLLLAIDFGRVFFGWVALNNAARIAASEAGFHPDAWKAPGNATLQASYRAEVVADMNAINCAPTSGGSWTPAQIPDPTFVNNAAGSFSSDPYEVGDHANVTLACNFSFLTPLVGLIVGDPMTIGASSEFPVKGGTINGIVVQTASPAPTAPPCANKIVPNLVGQSIAAARTAWTAAGFTGAFSPAAGFDSDTVTGQTTSPASSPGDCLVATATVSVAHQLQCTAPQLIGLSASAGQVPYVVAGFSGTYTIDRPPNSNYTIGSQSLVGGQVYVCSSNMTVFH